MNTTEISKEQLNHFVLAGKHYLNDREESELTKAIEMILPTAIKKLKKVERQRDAFRIAKAKKTGSKHLEKDKNGQYQFTEEDTKLVWEKMDEIDQEMIKVPCHIVEEYPTEDISYDIKMAFQGVVIPKIEISTFEEGEETEE